MKRPTTSETSRHDVVGDMAWPYRSAWRDVLSKSHAGSVILRLNHHSATGVPWLFVYANDKPVNLHDDAFLDRVRASHAQSSCVGVAGGHWCVVTNAQQVARALEEWLDATDHVLVSKM